MTIDIPTYAGLAIITILTLCALVVAWRRYCREMDNALLEIESLKAEPEWRCPECGSFDTEELHWADDFASRECRECGYQGEPGEDFPTFTKQAAEIRALRAQVERLEGERDGLKDSLREELAISTERLKELDQRDSDDAAAAAGELYDLRAQVERLEADLADSQKVVRAFGDGNTNLANECAALRARAETAERERGGWQRAAHAAGARAETAEARVGELEAERAHADAAAIAYQEAGQWLARIPDPPNEPHTSSGREPGVWVSESELERVLSGLAGLQERADELSEATKRADAHKMAMGHLTRQRDEARARCERLEAELKEPRNGAR